MIPAVIPFPSARQGIRRDPRGLMEAVYAAGSLPLAAGDVEAKALAATVSLFGFVLIHEIRADGTARRLRSSEAVRADAARPWRLSRSPALAPWAAHAG